MLNSAAQAKSLAMSYVEAQAKRTVLLLMMMPRDGLYGCQKLIRTDGTVGISVPEVQAGIKAWLDKG